MISTGKCFGVLRSSGSVLLGTALNGMTKNLLPCTFQCEILYSSQGSNLDERQPAEKPVSKAMRAYIKRAKDHEEFMKKEIIEYKIGKRHLANMMGEDPEEFTQEDVDRAIQYLFPSGLFEPKARPIMKPPEEIYPLQKAAEFDASGRPFSSFFYTGKPNFYKLLYDTVERLDEVNAFEDNMIKKHLSPDPTKTLDMSASDWIDQEVLEQRLVEKLHDNDYKNFVTIFTRLANHPYSYHIANHIMEYRKPLFNKDAVHSIPEPSYDADGRAYVTVERTKRKSSFARVTVWGQGSGKIAINGQNLKYFKNVQDREQVIFPLIFTDKLRKVDVDARVEGGGDTGQAGSIRLGIAFALRSFVDQDMQDRMRLAGLLTKDRRTKERKKPGQEGARRKYSWSKR